MAVAGHCDQCCGEAVEALDATDEMVVDGQDRRRSGRDSGRGDGRGHCRSGGGTGRGSKDKPDYGEQQVPRRTDDPRLTTAAATACHMSSYARLRVRSQQLSTQLTSTHPQKIHHSCRLCRR